MWHVGDGWGWWMMFGSAWMIGFWALVIWGVLTLVRRGQDTQTEHRPMAEPTALDLLQRRYANGELTDEQYERMRERLRNGSLS